MSVAMRAGLTGDVPEPDELRRRCPQPHRDLRRIPTCGGWYSAPATPDGYMASFWTWPDERTGDPQGLIYPVVCCAACARPHAYNPDLNEDQWTQREE